MLKSLSGGIARYKAELILSTDFKDLSQSLQERAKKSALKDFPGDEVLCLKVGTKVILTANLNVEKGLVNGAKGTVVSFDDNFPRVRFKNVVVRVCYHSWEINPFQKKNVSIRVGQVPLKPSYALTIHKSQGQSIRMVNVDLKKIFTFGQAYTAISRSETLDGLSLQNWDVQKVKSHPKVLAFYNGLL